MHISSSQYQRTADWCFGLGLSSLAYVYAPSLEYLVGHPSARVATCAAKVSQIIFAKVDKHYQNHPPWSILWRLEDLETPLLNKFGNFLRNIQLEWPSQSDCTASKRDQKLGIEG
jgi:hypothetical protein